MRKPFILLIGILIGISISNFGTENLNTTQSTQTQADGKYNTSQVEFYDNMIAQANTIKIYDSADMTEEILTNRDGKIIVEKIIGKVTNYKLDGKILNCNANNQGYISYERVDGAKQGDKIVTYYIYNPFTNEQDDVLTRLDFIIDDNAI